MDPSSYLVIRARTSSQESGNSDQDATKAVVPARIWFETPPPAQECVEGSGLNLLGRGFCSGGFHQNFCSAEKQQIRLKIRIA